MGAAGGTETRVLPRPNPNAKGVRGPEAQVSLVAQAREHNGDAPLRVSLESNNLSLPPKTDRGASDRYTP